MFCLLNAVRVRKARTSGKRGPVPEFSSSPVFDRSFPLILEQRDLSKKISDQSCGGGLGVLGIWEVSAVFGDWCRLLSIPCWDGQVDIG